MTDKQWHPDDLQRVFPSMPEGCSHALMDAAGSLKEECEMKGYTPRHTQRRYGRLVPVVALALVCMMGAALAAIYPRITEAFGQRYGADTQAWLEQGNIALPADALQVEGVTFTLDEVAWRSHGLYGLGTITPGEGMVLLGEGSSLGDAYGYAVHTGDEAPAGTHTIQEKAAQEGSAIKQAAVRLEKIGVDGGALLAPGDWGIGVYPQRDGSLQFLLEAEDGGAIAQGESYTLQLTALVCSVSADGTVDMAHAARQAWTVTMTPKPYAEVAGTAAPAATAIPAVSATPAERMQIVVPQAYTENGTLPVYAAVARDFSQGLDYAWFNPSGVTKETLDARHGGGAVDFADGGHLDWGSYYFFYSTYDGTYEATGELEDGSASTEILPRLSLPAAVSDMASWMVHGFPGTGEVYSLEQAELGSITLAQAQAQAQALMANLGMTGYTCTTALDMGVERIHKMGALLNEAIDTGKLYTNAFRQDYAAATAADEGYFLCYHKFGSDGDIAGQFEAVFYITADGIKTISLRDAYQLGSVVQTPASLVDAQTVAAALPGEMASSRYPEKLRQITRATLTWMPVREGKGDGMVMTPVWVLSYLTEESQPQGYECWAVFDAIHGTLLDAIFN